MPKREKSTVNSKAASLTQKAEKDATKTEKDRYVENEACEAPGESAADLSNKAIVSKKRKLKIERGQEKFSKKDNCKKMDEKASRTKCESLGKEETAGELDQEPKLIENATKCLKPRNKRQCKKRNKTEQI